jgi:hypothetical protein
MGSRDWNRAQRRKIGFISDETEQAIDGDRRFFALACLRFNRSFWFRRDSMRLRVVFLIVHDPGCHTLNILRRDFFRFSHRFCSHLHDIGLRLLLLGHLLTLQSDAVKSTASS